mmetsp:Transcript_14986/g.38830  ORF Transcript_14986/g.38830 Transcript_14986/m.38830 type:complete len:582 (-) Transcript_14986:113-1858(-)
MLFQDELQQLLLPLPQCLVRVAEAPPLVVSDIVDLLQPHQVRLILVQRSTLPLDVLFGHLQVQNGSQACVVGQPPVHLGEERRPREHLVSARRPLLVGHGAIHVVVHAPGGDGDEARLLHGLQADLVAPEDVPEENVVRHAMVGAVAGGEQPDRTPELRPRPLCTLLAAHQEAPHRLLGSLDETPNRLLGLGTLVDLGHERGDVPEAATDHGELLLRKVQLVAGSEVVLQQTSHGTGPGIRELLHVQTLGPVAQGGDHGRLRKGGVRDEQHARKLVLRDIRRPRHDGVEKTLSARLVLRREAGDDDQWQRGGRCTVSAQPAVLPQEHRLRRGREDALARDQHLILAAQLARARKHQVQDCRHLAVHALWRPIAQRLAEVPQENTVVHGTAGLQHARYIDVDCIHAHDFANQGGLAVAAVASEQQDAVLRVCEPTSQLVHLLAAVRPKVGQQAAPGFGLELPRGLEDGVLSLVVVAPSVDEQAPQAAQTPRARVLALAPFAVVHGGLGGQGEKPRETDLDREGPERVPNEVGRAHQHRGHEGDGVPRVARDGLSHPFPHERLELNVELGQSCRHILASGNGR